VVYCPWAGRYYARMKNKGKKHAAAARSVLDLATREPDPR
jgi:hypothetical protein